MSEQPRRPKKERRRERFEPHFLPIEDRVNNFNEVNLGYLTEEEVKAEADRCVLCRNPKCVQACPAHFNIREMLVDVQEGKFNEAADIVNDFYCFPSSLNRVCVAFCQQSCVNGKKGDPVQILNIKRYLSDNFSKPASFYERNARTPYSIAIIGSGPAGLSAAYDLAKKGHRVTIFEKADILGGMLALGIPEYRLKNNLLHSEIKELERLGVEFVTGVALGRDITIEWLKTHGYDAVFIGHGAHKPKWMNIPGNDLIGNVHAVEFLRDVALGKKPTVGNKVAVIGGGDVAIDAVRVSHRLGADAQIIYRRSREEMPAAKDEIEETENEHIPINYLTNPVEIIGSEGKVTHIKLIKMELGEPDESGRRRPIPIEGSEYTIPIDMVIQVISQEPEEDGFENFELTKWNTFKVDENFETSIEGVFAAGDDVTGPKTAIEAIADAKKAATAIHTYLLEREQALTPVA